MNPVAEAQPSITKPSGVPEMVNIGRRSVELSRLESHSTWGRAHRPQSHPAPPGRVSTVTRLFLMGQAIGSS
jgi:hypothetical protein